MPRPSGSRPRRWPFARSTWDRTTCWWRAPSTTWARSSRIRRSWPGPSPSTARPSPCTGSCTRPAAIPRAIYRAEKKYAEAEPLYVRALAIREKTLGLDHPDVATTLNNLGALHDAQDHYEQAEAYYRRAIAIREKALGPTHIETAATLASLGEIYMEQRKFDKAEEPLRRAYFARVKALGEKDPDTKSVQRDLWALYMGTDRLALAEEFTPEGEQTPNLAQRQRAASQPLSPKGTDPTR